MPRKYKNPHKPDIISLRISDDDMEIVQQVLESTNTKAGQGGLIRGSAGGSTGGYK